MDGQNEEDMPWPEGAVVRTAVVTGSNTGIGKETARGLAASGLYDLVVFACRSKEKAEEAICDVRQRLPPECRTALQYRHVDLSSLDSVRAFAKKLQSNPAIRLKALVNNAGMAPSLLPGTKHMRKMVDGFEACFGVNFLSHFLLTLLLLDSLKAAAPSRVVNLSSVMHRSGARDLSAYSEGLHHLSAKSYANSKLAMVLFTTKLDSMLQGTGVEVHAVNPGAVNSNIWRYIPGPLLFLCHLLFYFIFLTPQQGASTSIHAATAEGIGSNKYWSPYWVPIASLAWIMEYVGYYVRYAEVAPHPAGRDMSLANGLYDLCEKAVGLGGSAPADPTGAAVH